MLTIAMLSDMSCPICPSAKLKAKIEKQQGNKIIEGELICEETGERFPVHSGIPNLIPESKLSSSEWKMWQDHLEGFQERRMQRIREPHRQVNQWGKKSKPQSRFSEFANITDGKVLDLGCGPGKFRFHLDQKHVQYYGLDPVVLPEVEDFSFVRALSEYLPFKDNTFSHLVVIAALDHFKDLEAFFKEAMRVLKPQGKLHIVQSIHELRGPLSAVKMFSHWVKDSLEDRATKIKNPNAPKHITEFSSSSLATTLAKYFVVEAMDKYSHKWYSPTKLFLSLSPKTGLHEPVEAEEEFMRKHNH